MTKDVTFVIRSADERTEFVCKKLILEQSFSESQVFIVKTVPFSAAMRTSFDIGIKQARKWTFCIDADVFMKPGSVDYMITEAEKTPENTCEIQGLVLDKFFGGARPAGNHLYRTSLLPEVMKHIPQEGTNIRPEHYTLEKMKLHGHPWFTIPYIVGLHDEEQNYVDIYRKCFVQGVKHLYLANLFVPHWKRNLAVDSDFSVALTAFADSIVNTQNVYINKDLPIFIDGFYKMLLVEKKELQEDLWNGEKVEQMIQNWIYSPEYNKKYPDRFGLLSNESHVRKVQNQKRKSASQGIFRLFRHTLNSLLRK